MSAFSMFACWNLSFLSVICRFISCFLSSLHDKFLSLPSVCWTLSSSTFYVRRQVFMRLTACLVLDQFNACDLFFKSLGFSSSFHTMIYMFSHHHIASISCLITQHACIFSKSKLRCWMLGFPASNVRCCQSQRLMPSACLKQIRRLHLISVLSL